MKTAIGSHNLRSIAKALALHKVWPKACPGVSVSLWYGGGFGPKSLTASLPCAFLHNGWRIDSRYVLSGSPPVGKTPPISLL